MDWLEPPALSLPFSSYLETAYELISRCSCEDFRRGGISWPCRGLAGAQDLLYSMLEKVGQLERIIEELKLQFRIQRGWELG
jgi:hypothetical protein